MKRIPLRTIRVLILGVLLTSQTSFSASVVNSRVVNTTDNNLPTQNSVIKNSSVASSVIGTAQDWGVNEEEWIRYQMLMQGSNGLWYPKLTPLEVLGINARTKEEQQHFAMLVAKEEHDRLARELAFDSAVHDAGLAIYTKEPVIKAFDLSPFNPTNTAQKNEENGSVSLQANVQQPIQLQAGDHLILFVDISKAYGTDIQDTNLPKLLLIIKNQKGVVLDIYCVGQDDDTAIRLWAHLNKIPVALESEGRITLNANKGRFQKTVGKQSLPYVMLVRNGTAKQLLSGSF